MLTKDTTQQSVQTPWQRRAFYYGWVIVAVAGISMAFWFGFRTMFSVFLVALVDDFGWGRGETAAAQSLAMICYIVSAPIAGGMVDRFGPRRVIVPGILLFALGMVLCGTVQSLAEFYLFFGLLAGLGVTFISLSTYTALIPHWFEKRRGAASGIAASGMGLGIVIFVPLSQALVSNWGWRSSYLILGVATAVILLPLNGLLLRHRPQDMGYAGPDGRLAAGSAEANPSAAPAPSSKPEFRWGVREAMRTTNFWALMVFPMLAMIGIYTVSVHFVGFLVVQGMDKMVAASAFALIGIISTAFRIIWGSVSDRIGREKAYSVGMFFFCVSFYCLFHFEQTGAVWLVYLFVFLAAMGWGATAPMFMAAAADLFHGPAIGAIYGLLEGSVGIGGAFGAWIGGHLFDKTGSYMQAFAVAAVSGVLSILLMWVAAPRKGALLKQKAMASRGAAVKAG